MEIVRDDYFVTPPLLLGYFAEAFTQTVVILRYDGHASSRAHEILWAKPHATEALERRNPSNGGSSREQARQSFISWRWRHLPSSADIESSGCKRGLSAVMVFWSQRGNTADAHNMVSILLSWYRPPPTYRRTLVSRRTPRYCLDFHVLSVVPVKRVYHIYNVTVVFDDVSVVSTLPRMNRSSVTLYKIKLSLFKPNH